jgi:hypothetical protein
MLVASKTEQTAAPYSSDVGVLFCSCLLAPLGSSTFVLLFARALSVRSSV